MTLPVPAAEGSPAILSVALDGLSPATQRAYLSDLRAFANDRGYRNPIEALESFLELGAGDAHAAAMDWRGQLEARKLAPRTVSRKLSTLRRLVRSAKRQGVISWLLDVDGPKLEGTVRDTAGPQPEHVDAVVQALTEAGREAGAQLALRDLAILLLLHDSGLRCSEVCSLEIRHVDLAADRVRIAPKGAGGARRWWGISPRARRALGRWLRARGRRPGPVFCGVGTGRATTGIGRKTVWRRVVWWAEQCGFEGWRPHGLRHAAITKLQRATGDLERARRFARHSSPVTTSAHYIDGDPDEVRADIAIVARKSRARK